MTRFVRVEKAHMCLEKKDITSVFSFLDNELDAIPPEETIFEPPSMYELYCVRITQKNTNIDMVYVASISAWTKDVIYVYCNLNERLARR